MSQKPAKAHNFALASLGPDFVEIGQAGEAGKRLNEIGFDTSSLLSNAAQLLNQFSRCFC